MASICAWQFAGLPRRRVCRCGRHELSIQGTRFEARLNAEECAKGFLAATGTVDPFAVYKANPRVGATSGVVAQADYDQPVL